MKITFLGAAEAVTGSNFLVETNNKKFLIDCGLIQGKEIEEERNYDDFLYDPKSIDFMILTHAHIDHSGRIPKLYNEGYRGPIYATKATVDLCSIMLADSGYIQEQEADWKSRKRKREGKKLIEPLYTAQDAVNSLELFEKVHYKNIYQIDENIKARFTDAGHMLGSAIVELWITEDGKEEKIVFTGDIGNNQITLLDKLQFVDEADYLVMEATYGDRIHERNDEKAQLFLEIVSKTLKRGGNVVIPSFAVGRTQEILYEINKIKDNLDQEQLQIFKEQYEELMSAKVYVDSPLAISATEIFQRNMNLFGEEVREYLSSGDNPLEFKGLNFSKTAEESKSLNFTKEPIIVISASGMCEVGRIKHHLKHNLWNPKNTILFVGYQAPGTLGHGIISGEKKVKIFGEEIAVNAEIQYIEAYSGHADQEFLLEFISRFEKKPRNIFLVHGAENALENFKNLVIDIFKIETIIPAFGDAFILKDGVERLRIPDDLILERRRLEQLDTVSTIDKISTTIDRLVAELKENVIDKEVTEDEIREILDKISDFKSKVEDIKK